MMEQSLRITILMKDQNISFKVKKFPVHIGSMKGPNVIPLTGDGISHQHGTLTVQKGKLYYEDSSENGTKINNRAIHNQKVLLTPGNNELQIGRYRVVLENNFASSSSPLEFLNNKKVIIPGASALFLLVLALILFMFKLPPFFDSPLKIENFFLESPTITKNEPIRLDFLKIMEDKKVDTARINFNVKVVYNNREDSVTVTYEEFLNNGIKLPAWIKLNRPTMLEDEITLVLLPQSEEYEFEPKRIEKPFILSFRKESVLQSGVKMTTDVKPQLKFEYKFDPGNVAVANYEVSFGEGPKLSGKYFDKSVWFYSSPGEKKFTAVLTLANGTKLNFERKFYIN